MLQLAGQKQRVHTQRQSRSCSRTLAAQEIRHTTQGDTEKVADFIRRLEHTFNVAYGREDMSVETRDTLLHGQLQDGLKHDFMQAPAVSGAQTYRKLCLAARNEKKRLAELKKRQQHFKPLTQQHHQFRRSTETKPVNKPAGSASTSGAHASSLQRKCFLCHESGHLARSCRKKVSNIGRRDQARVITVRSKSPLRQTVLSKESLSL